MRMENGVLVVRPADVSLKINEVAEKIISALMEADEIDIVGVSSGIYLTTAAITMSKDIANVNVKEVCIDYIEVPVLGKIEMISAQLGKKVGPDFKHLVAEEEGDMTLTTDREGQTISVSQRLSLDKLLTFSLMKFSRFDKLKIMAAGRSVSDAVSLALKLSKGQISKETIGIDLIDIYSIAWRKDPTRKTTAISIYLKKGTPTQYSKRHAELIKKLSIQA